MAAFSFPRQVLMRAQAEAPGVQAAGLAVSPGLEASEVEVEGLQHGLQAEMLADPA